MYIDELYELYGMPMYDAVIDVYKVRIAKREKGFDYVWFIKSLCVPGAIVYSLDIERAYKNFLAIEKEMDDLCETYDVWGGENLGDHPMIHLLYDEEEYKQSLEEDEVYTFEEALQVFEFCVAKAEEDAEQEFFEHTVTSLETEDDFDEESCKGCENFEECYNNDNLIENDTPDNKSTNEYSSHFEEVGAEDGSDQDDSYVFTIEVNNIEDLENALREFIKKLK